MADDTRWLSAGEQEIWREVRRFAWEFPSALDRQLQRDSALSGPEYSVLAQLSESEGGRRRAGDLAAALDWERSRLSHLLRRMEARGLTERCPFAGDARGQEVSLTAAGWDVLRAAAPGHVTFVRESVFDPLEPAEREQLRSMLARIREAGERLGHW